MMHMNYKRCKPHRTKKLKRRELNSRKASGWLYGGGIAREIVNRRDFRRFLDNLF